MEYQFNQTRDQRVQQIHDFLRQMFNYDQAFVLASIIAELERVQGAPLNMAEPYSPELFI